LHILNAFNHLTSGIVKTSIRCAGVQLDVCRACRKQAYIVEVPSGLEPRKRGTRGGANGSLSNRATHRGYAYIGRGHLSANLTNFIYLDRVAVTAAWQGKGIGADLYREVESRSTADWFALEVNTKPRNEGSLKFHAREGFVEMEECETRPGKKVSLMAKKLRG
jgi:GNAT superfamily N-acetyltransferase